MLSEHIPRALETSWCLWLRRIIGRLPSCSVAGAIFSPTSNKFSCFILWASHWSYCCADGRWTGISHIIQRPIRASPSLQTYPGTTPRRILYRRVVLWATWSFSPMVRSCAWMVHRQVRRHGVFRLAHLSDPVVFWRDGWIRQHIIHDWTVVRRSTGSGSYNV